MDETPKKPWWRKKRWRLVVVTWALLPPLYAASNGPACYCVGRGWVADDDPALLAFYWPLHYVAQLTALSAQSLVDYNGWWLRHGECDNRP